MEMSEVQKKEIIPGYLTVEDFTKDGFKILMDTIRKSNLLPSQKDWRFYSTHNCFVDVMSTCGNCILNTVNFTLSKYEVEGNIKTRSLVEKMDLMIDANDIILERAAINIDEMNGIKKNYVDPVILQTVTAELPLNGSWNRIENAKFSSNASLNSKFSVVNYSKKSVHLLTGKNIIRPQKFFSDKIDNSNKFPWLPRISFKPNSLKPLAIFLEETINGEEYSHPYEFELEKFEPLEEQLNKTLITKPKPVMETPLIEVESEEQLNILLQDLYKQKEFAVDLEHHSYRSFMGITCLMQISTYEKDYLIDTLKLRNKLHILNEVFTKPSIVKIFHGADLDIQWLQRDLSLYVVNMFDTHQAAKQLEYPGCSLAYLLKKFCDFIPNKQFQLADWRIRPLPDELKMYAREDTHYLIFIYHLLKNELLKKCNGNNQMLKSVIWNSTQICKRRYLKPRLKEDSHLDFYRKCKRLFDNRQLFALKRLYKWRDQISRDEDESTGYVLPNHMLLQISESLPREMQGILACCNPIPPLVRANLLEIHKIILEARDQSLVKPILKEDNHGRGSVKQFSKVNVDSLLHCPHDLTNAPEYRDDLFTLLKNPVSLNSGFSEMDIEKSWSDITVFDDSKYDIQKNSENIEKMKDLKFLGPYERYKLVKPFVKAEEEKLSAGQETALIVIKNEGQTEQQEKQYEESHSKDTNADSIAALHEHFVNLIRQIPQKVPENHLENLQHPLPLKNSKKRKLNEDTYFNDIPNSNMTSNLNNNFKQKPEKHCHNIDGTNSPNKKFKGVSKKKQKNKNKSLVQNQELQHNKKLFLRPIKNQKKSKNAGKRQQFNAQVKNFTPYDYSSVDYKQFQGGASSAQSVKIGKTRGKKKFGGKNNKSQSFHKNNFP